MARGSFRGRQKADRSWPERSWSSGSRRAPPGCCLTPAYEVAVRLPGDLTENMVRAQGRLDVAELNADPLIAGLIADHGLLVVGGRYNLTSGAVEIIA
jgi:hypothetical protein